MTLPYQNLITLPALLFASCCEWGFSTTPPLHLPHINCRKPIYIHIARDDLQRRDLFKPAQYIRCHLDQLPLLRLRTQATSHIPSHLHLANDHTYTPYDQRYRPSYRPNQIVGNELHTFLHCPHATRLSPSTPPQTRQSMDSLYLHYMHTTHLLTPISLFQTPTLSLSRARTVSHLLPCQSPL